MRDEALITDAKLSPAESAVNYVLRRVRVDANLRYYMRHTEAFARLCSAEAHRLNKTAEEIAERYTTPPPHAAKDQPMVVVLREILLKMEGHLWEYDFQHTDWGRALLEEINRVW